MNPEKHASLSQISTEGSEHWRIDTGTTDWFVGPTMRTSLGLKSLEPTADPMSPLREEPEQSQPPLNRPGQLKFWTWPQNVNPLPE